ncbi:hypothetical protein Shyd_27930 [Streptomyces hydrogenans]|uniref:Integral membrane protein n=1 Tax=Streptomyces hydrogenans TaxID=1873719 RepID=A0ABQ3P8T8_9ACTN|nr:hypothetical protein [Streptomyces hydrogenans]GHI21422.1 hypothetical protein Shyd_27930 [Streptomyces hydrogenans]
MTTSRSPLRTLRAALFAVVCVVLAAVGHSSMSAHALDPRTLLTAFAVTAAVAWCAAGRRRGPAAYAGGTLAAQAALHLAFSLTGAHTPPAGGAATGTAHPPSHLGHPDHLGHEAHSGPEAATTADTVTRTLTETATTPDGLAALLAPVADGGPGMLAVHVLAALVCGLWLARGEAAFLALAEAALTPLRHLLAVPLGPVAVPADPRRPVRRPRRNARRPHVVVLAHVLSRRGPPRPPVPRATVLGPLV